MLTILQFSPEWDPGTCYFILFLFEVDPVQAKCRRHSYSVFSFFLWSSGFIRKSWIRNMNDSSVEDLSAEWTMPLYMQWVGWISSFCICCWTQQWLNIFGKDPVTCFTEDWCFFLFNPCRHGGSWGMFWNFRVMENASGLFSLWQMVHHCCVQCCCSVETHKF